MDIKQFIQEEVSKLHKKTLLENRKAEIEKLLKEYNNYDYPAGADADPNAPWNQSEENPEFDSLEIEQNGDTLDTFYIKVIGNSGTSHASNSLLEILEELQSNEEIMQYFEGALMEKGAGNAPSPELNARLTEIASDWFANVADVQGEESEAPEYERDID